MRRLWVFLFPFVLSASPLIDGVISPADGWVALSGSAVDSVFGEADLDTLYGYLTPDTLYLAIKTRNTVNRSVSYGFGVDLDRLPGSGYDAADGASDAWGRALTFADTLGGYNFSVDVEIYFQWDSATASIAAQNLAMWDPALQTWNFLDLIAIGASYVFSATDTTGLQVLEVAIPRDSSMLPFSSLRVTAWVAGTTGTSAVDGAPADPAFSDAGAGEWGDVDTIFAFAHLSRFARSGDVRIQEVMYDPPYGEPRSEWVELWNAAPDTVDVSFWVFTDDPDPLGSTEGRVWIPDGVLLPPGHFLILANDSDSFQVHFAADIPPTSGVQVLNYRPLQKGSISMSNTGDDIHLFGGNIHPFMDSLAFWSMTLEVDRVWYEGGGDLGPTDAYPDNARSRSIERIPGWVPTGIPAQDFFTQQSAQPWSPGDIPPEVHNLLSVPAVLPETASLIWMARVLDTVPVGDGVDSVLFLLDGGSGGPQVHFAVPLGGDSFQVSLPAPVDTGGKTVLWWVHVVDLYANAYTMRPETLQIQNVPPRWDTLWWRPNPLVDTPTVVLVGVRRELFPVADSIRYSLNGGPQQSAPPDSSRGDTLFFSVTGLSLQDTLWVRFWSLDVSGDTGVSAPLTLVVGNGGAPVFVQVEQMPLVVYDTTSIVYIRAVRQDPTGIVADSMDWWNSRTGTWTRMAAAAVVADTAYYQLTSATFQARDTIRYVVHAWDAGGLMGSSDTLQFVVQPSVAVEEGALRPGPFAVRPHPRMLEVRVPRQGRLEIRVMNLLGQEVWRPVRRAVAPGILRLHVPPTLPRGVYFWTARYGGRNYRGRWVYLK